MSLPYHSTVTGKVSGLVRLNNSVNGNPRYWVTIDTGEDEPTTLKTSSDAAIVYEISNPEFRDDLHTFALTKAGLISHVIEED